MVSRGYKHATEDLRGIFSRFLPTTWRDLETSRRDTHNGVVGAIQDSLRTAEEWAVESKKESWLDTADGTFLDKWGKTVGLNRRQGESDDHYRKRIHDYIIAKRGTINAIVTAIEREFEDDDLKVWIYEPWRNIFYLNSSLLNGHDHLQGFYYRFADINIHISKPVDQARLDWVVDHYKDAGVLVYYTYEPGLMPDAPVYDIDNSIAGKWVDVSTEFGVGRYKSLEYTLGQVNPNVMLEGEEFITNDSDLNSLDYLSGNPYSGKLSYNFVFQTSEFNPTPDGAIDGYLANSIQASDDIYKFSNAKDGLFGNLYSTGGVYSVTELTKAFLSTVKFDVTVDGTLHVTYSEFKGDQKYADFVNMLQGSVRYELDSSKGILAYIARLQDNLTNSPVIKYLDDVLTRVTFAINHNDGTASVSPVLKDDDLRILNFHPHMVFDFNQWYLNNRSDLDKGSKTTARYIQFNNYGSAYGFNIHNISILDKSLKELSTEAKWIYLNGDTVPDNKVATYPLSYPQVSSGVWVMDLGAQYDISKITVSDSYAGPNAREISISSNNIDYYTIDKQNSTSTGVVTLVDYEHSVIKGKWISSRFTDASLTIVARNNSNSPTYVEAFNFTTNAWDTLSVISGRLFKTYLVDSLNLSDYISNTGLLMFRMENALRTATDSQQLNIDVDYFGFTINTQIRQSLPSYGTSVSMQRTTV